MIIRVIDAYVYIPTNDGLLFLLLKRAKTKMYEHIWQGVAGKIEKGEKSWETAKRELKEETGLKPNKMFLTNLHSDLDYNKLLLKLPKKVKPAYDGLTLNL